MKVEIEFTEEDCQTAMKGYVDNKLRGVFQRPVCQFSSLYGRIKCTVTEDDTPVEQPTAVPAMPDVKPDEGGPF